MWEKSKKKMPFRTLQKVIDCNVKKTKGKKMLFHTVQKVKKKLFQWASVIFIDSQSAHKKKKKDTTHSFIYF